MAAPRKMCDHQTPAKCKCPWKVTYRDTDGVQRQKTYPHDKKQVANDFARKVGGGQDRGSPGGHLHGEVRGVRGEGDPPADRDGRHQTAVPQRPAAPPGGPVRAQACDRGAGQGRDKDPATGDAPGQGSRQGSDRAVPGRHHVHRDGKPFGRRRSPRTTSAASSSRPKTRPWMMT